MAIIKQYHKDTDTTYVYESVSYWDAEKGQSRSKRRVIGKLDPVTGEIIPTQALGILKVKTDFYDYLNLVFCVNEEINRIQEGMPETVEKKR